MGIFGWTEHKDAVSITGVVRDVTYTGTDAFADRDWCLKVHPSDGSAWALTSPYGYTNTNAIIECEVHPDEDFMQAQGPQWWWSNFFSGLRGKQVTVQGTWVTDNSHTFTGEDNLLGLADMGKTEIHPIASVLAEEPTIHGPEYLRVYRFLVFTETRKGNSPPVGPNPGAPHIWENRVGTFSIPCPEDWTYSIYNVFNRARAANFSFGTDAAGKRVLLGRVESGTVDEGKGFYSASITVRSPKALRPLRLVSLSPSEVYYDSSHEVRVQVVDGETGAQVPGATVSMRNPPQPYYSYDANQPFRWTFIPRRVCRTPEDALLPQIEGGYLNFHNFYYFSPPMPETLGEEAKGEILELRQPVECYVVESPSGSVTASGYTGIRLPFKFKERSQEPPP